MRSCRGSFLCGRSFLDASKLFPEGPRLVLPPLDNNIGVFRVELDEPRPAPRMFCCDHRRAGPAERVEHDIAAVGRVADRPLDQRNRLHRRMQIVLVRSVEEPDDALVPSPAPVVIGAVFATHIGSARTGADNPSDPVSSCARTLRKARTIPHDCSAGLRTVAIACDCLRTSASALRRQHGSNLVTDARDDVGNATLPRSGAAVLHQFAREVWTIQIAYRQAALRRADVGAAKLRHDERVREDAPPVPGRSRYALTALHAANHAMFVSSPPP